MIQGATAGLLLAIAGWGWLSQLGSVAPRWVAPSGDLVAMSVPRPDRVLLPAATFEMGSGAEDVMASERLCRREGGTEALCDWNQLQNEMPRRTARLAAYRIDRTEVTYGAFQRCVRAGVCRSANHFPGDHRFDGDRQPAVGVSWRDAAAYCRWTGGRLPTEAEWEHAARGGDARLFPWGRVWNPHLANHGRIGLTSSEFLAPDDDDGFRYTAPVDSYPEGRSPYGLADLAGNVSEWVADFYQDDAYALDFLLFPGGPPNGAFRVVRGGSWITPPHFQTVTRRDGRLPDEEWLEVGFRCAADAE